MKLDARKILRWGPALIGLWMILAAVASDADPEEGLPLGQEERVPVMADEKFVPPPVELKEER